MLTKGRQKQWLWCISRRDAAFYRIDPSRGYKVIVALLEGFEGVTVSLLSMQSAPLRVLVEDAVATTAGFAPVRPCCESASAIA